MRAELVAFTASVLINAGVLASVDHSVVYYDRALSAGQMKTQTRNTDSLIFEFIESPPKTHARRPTDAHRVSDHDSLNQDLTPDKTSAQDLPQVKTVGPSDQLAQQRAEAASSPAAASPALAKKPPLMRQTESGKPKEKTQAVSEFGAEQSPLVHGLSGADRITTPEISKSRSHGAQLYGVTSFEATGSGMGEYMKNLKEKIWLAWFPYLVIHYPKDFQTADALVSIHLNAQGQVKIVELAENTGSPLFAAFCMEAIQSAGAFGPVPQEILDLLGKDELEIKFAFHYW